MLDDPFTFNPVARITVGAIGRPGHRTFFLQASQGERVLTLKLEKEHLYALARGIDNLLEELERDEICAQLPAQVPSASALALQEPIDCAYQIVQMGLAYDQTSRLILLVAFAAAIADETDTAHAHFWATMDQMRCLSRRAREVAAQGRPICPLCQQPMDPDGHTCPRHNGHSRKPFAR
ncbi:MAG: DUF3090 domain-containing protein [Chloroflexi bacterium]|nr:DUF3090 domain-containing protein [Chloroflexota bacterium]